jgi:hypothetical protein
MKWDVSGEFSKGLRIAAIAVVVTGSVAAPSAYAASAASAASAAYGTPPNDLIVAPPTDAPEWARQAGEAALLQKSPEAQTLPYIEHAQRARLSSVHGNWRRYRILVAPLLSDCPSVRRNGRPLDRSGLPCHACAGNKSNPWRV